MIVYSVNKGGVYLKVNVIEKTYRSFHKEDFEHYFSNRGKCKNPGVYIGDGWLVYLGDERKELVGPMEFITITITIEISIDIQEEFIAELRKSFLKGGG
ncbi:hypothetical protein GC105_09825 [Alkalibaculum sp. M08DMB]|uniref:Molybdopterin cofactor biosynthesis MoaD-related C-terminal domain-containing protein n=1 Tax=Alkalibaculum sporogenes TaxID=2655001 RepID=A0A6A7K999_9FIRM|nr:hypothetical protein [Alkalibaculum sporogenes]MPW26089.1 hypothetical protein [Alkalibaculum sporogenes]